jgi:hypothetical protein
MTAQSDHFARSSAVSPPVTADADGAAPVTLDTRSGAGRFTPSASPWRIPGLDCRLTELNARGLPFSDIAAQLNEEFGTSLSRGACIGRASRMKLPHRVTYHAGRVIRRVATKPPAQPAPTAKARNEPRTARCKLIELGNHDCRYPFGEVAPYLYCAQATVENSSWCPKHFRVVYAPTRAR